MNLAEVIAEIVAKAIAEAVADEREACAEIAQAIHDGWIDRVGCGARAMGAKAAADAIRNRGARGEQNPFEGEC